MNYPKRIKINELVSFSKLSKPKIVTFDAYNTLYATTLPVMEQYSRIGNKYGLLASTEDLTSRFPKVFKELKQKHPNYGKWSGLSPHQWWGTLIANVFAPERVPSSMVAEILQVFEGFGAYTVYPDLLEFLKSIKQKHPDIILGVVSNTDPIMYSLLQNIGLKPFFDQHIYLSYDLELSKPDPAFFERVLHDIVTKHPYLLKNATLEELKANCWHIGDEEVNDLQGPVKAGWNAVLIDRSDKYTHFSDSLEKRERTVYQLYADKIDNDASKSWELSMKQTDTIQLSAKQYVVSNFQTLARMFNGPKF